MTASRTPAVEPKASRVRVWQAADRILRSGRRPTVEGVRETLGGGSPNAVTAYLNDWYRELGGRLAAAEAPLAGFPAEAVSMMTELWRLAAADQAGAHSAEADVAAHVLQAERDALRAEAKALQVLNQELQRHRGSAEKSLTETRALLVRREAALEDERARAAAREQELAHVRLELEVMRERQRLAPAVSRAAVRKPGRRAGPAATARPAKRKHTTARVARSTPKGRTSGAASKRPRRRKALRR